MGKLHPIDTTGFIELIDKFETDSALKIVNSARISYNKSKDAFDSKDSKLCDFLWNNGHTCYDDSTEVLTSQGFILWSKITVDHELAVVDPHTSGMIGFEKPQALINEEYKDQMISLNSRDVSMLVTPNHKLYCSLSSTQKKRRKPQFELTRADDVWQKPMRLQSCCASNLQTKKHEESLAAFKFFGFYVGDGMVLSENRVGFHLKKERKKSYLRSILNEMCVPYTESTHKNGKTKFYVEMKGAKQIMSPYGIGSHNKTLPDTCLRLPTEHALAILDGLRNSDGSQKRSSWVYSTVSQDLANKIQALGSINGLAFSLTQNARGMFQLQLRTRSTMPRVNDNSKTRMNKVNYQGRVYCAKVSTGLLIVRRDNKVHLSGNSPYRHSFFTFHIKAPLFVFRQWVKYQVGSGWRKYEIGGDPVSAEVFDLFFDTDKGCSWNEISGRYVEIAPEFYVPEKMRTNPSHGNKQKSVDMHADFDHARERAEMLEDCKILYEKYMRRVQIGIAKEQARMLLPQNVYTQAYWTVSMQGVLHMLDQRLHPDAQWEIQQYAKCIQTALNEAVPNFSVLCKFAE